MASFAAVGCAAVKVPVLFARRRAGPAVPVGGAGGDVQAAVLEAVPIDMLQFHGSETPQRVAKARLRFARPVMKAVAIAGPSDVSGAASYEAVADRLLLSEDGDRLTAAARESWDVYEEL